MKCHIVDSLNEIGGQCSALYPQKPIYDIPGYPKILAADLIHQLYIQGKPFNPVFHLNQQATDITKLDNGFITTTSNNIQINSRIIIIAAGCGSFGPNRPPLERLSEFEGESIFYSIMNKENFRDKEIIIAGGGDSAVDWAIELYDIAKKIYILHRRNKFTALPENVKILKDLAKTSKLELVIGYQLHELEGGKGVLEAVKVRDFSNNIKTIKADILLPFYGLSQNLGPILDWGLTVNSYHILVNQPYFETNIPGIYAVGDIASYEGKLKLILTGFAEVASSLHHAYSKVFEGKALHFEYSTSKGLPNN